MTLMFDCIENKHDVCKSKNYMKKFCESLRENAMEMINFEKRKMIPLTNELKESYEKAEICYICKKLFEHKYTNDKNYCKVKDHCHYHGKYRVAARSIYNLKYSIHKEMLMIFNNESNYDHHSIIKELPKEFEEEFRRK